jgi:hypothetical protein
MTKLTGKVFGKSQVMEQHAAHFLKEAFDEFLIAEYSDTVLGSLIKLSIGLEIFIKKELEEINPCLIHATVNWKQLKQIFTAANQIVDMKGRRAYIIQKLGALPPQPDKTVDFSMAIALLPYFRGVPKRIMYDLDDLREYRNGLFHWEAASRESFRLSKQALRLLEWILAFIEKKAGWWLDGELIVIDPMGEKRKLLRKLKESIRSENIFNLQRRIFKHRSNYEACNSIGCILKGWTEIPKALVFKQACPACTYPEVLLYESGSKRNGRWEERRLFGQCPQCDFTFSDKEHDAIKPKNAPTLKNIFTELSQAATSSR